MPAVRRKSTTKERLECRAKGCQRWFKNQSGLTQHENVFHRELSEPHPNRDGLDEDMGVNDIGPIQSIHDSESGQSEPEDEDDEYRSDERPQDMEIDNVFHSNDEEENPPNNTRQAVSAHVVLPEEQPGLSDAENVHAGSRSKRIYHPTLTGTPCDDFGNYLPPNTPSSPSSLSASEKWAPFRNQVEFELVDFLYRRNEMAQRQVDDLMDLITALLRVLDPDAEPPFANHEELLNAIDSIAHGEVAWDSFELTYTGVIPEVDPPAWMFQKCEVWYRKALPVMELLLKNKEFDGEFDYSPYKMFGADGKQIWRDLMSGDWAWAQADAISALPGAEGCVFVPVVAGSDKTTVSVATGQNEYYPLYASPGNVHNNVRRAHRGAVVVIGFLSIPKADRKYDDNVAYRNFRRQLFHSSLSKIFETLRPHMTKYKVMTCPDGHKRRIIFGLGPYIADYPEQIFLAGVLSGWCGRCLSKPSNLDIPANNRCEKHTSSVVECFDAKGAGDAYGIVKDVVVFTNDFPRADICELLAPDLLHQVIKGTFKDHYVTWVEDFLILAHGPSMAKKILDDIDHRLAITPPFSCLRTFPQGRRFKQWTGDDSKGLMKIYLPAIQGHLPMDIIKTFRYLLDFCYLVRRHVQSEATLEAIKIALKNLHKYRAVFQVSGVRPKGISLPRQHSLVHYHSLIKKFGAPNGLCSSITESKHIQAVKKPWRRSNRYHALKQMLITNQRLDKLESMRAYLKAEKLLQPMHSMLFKEASGEGAGDPTHIDEAEEQRAEPDSDADDGVVDGPTIVGSVHLAATPQRNYPHDFERLATQRGFDDLLLLTQKFLYHQLHPDASSDDLSRVSVSTYNLDNAKLNVFHSAVAVFFAPSDPSGKGGMRREYIRCTPSWRNGQARYDTVYVETDPSKPGMRGMHIARVFLLFSFPYGLNDYPCALVQWFESVDDEPDDETGMWVVAPAFAQDDSPLYAVIHMDCIIRAAHLIPVFGEGFIPDAHELDSSRTLDDFLLFYVNTYIDHHANEIAF